MKNLPNISLNSAQYFAILAVVVLGFRLPYWFIDVISWDESTFIIMGQGLVNGILPYTDLWDLKPPFAFTQVAIFLSVFGESVLAVRLAGAVYVLATAFFVFLIAEKLLDRRAAIFASLLYIPISSLYWYAQGTLTEQLAILPVVAAMYLFIRFTVSHKTAFSIGLLVSLAVLTRLNLAYVAITTGFLILIYAEATGLKRKLMFGVTYSAAGLIPVAIYLSIYAASGNLELLKLSLVDAPLSYATQQNSFLRSSSLLLGEMLNPASLRPYVTLTHAVALCASLGMLLLAISDFKKDAGQTGGKDRKTVIVLMTFFATIAYSIASTGASHGHYLLQLTPFFAIFAAVCFFNLCKYRSQIFAGLFAVVFLGLAAIGWKRGPYEQFVKLYDQVETAGQYSHGMGYWAADLIETQNIPNYTVYAMSHHIVYFLLNKTPPTAIATHPSNVFKPFLVDALSESGSTPEHEFENILGKKPTFVVKYSDVWYMADYPNESQLLGQYLENYELIGEKQKLQVYQKRK